MRTYVAIIAFLVIGVTLAALEPQKQPKANPSEPKLSLGKPVQIDNLTLVPIESTIPLAPDKYYTLAEATKLGIVEIVEVPGQNQVNMLSVRNSGDLPILLFSGELLLGGKQDRIVAMDAIVPPRGHCDVRVFCVEHGRWTGSPKFESGDTFVPQRIRRAGYGIGSQGEVWDQVAKANASAGVAPATGTMRGGLEAPKVRAESGKLLTKLESRFRVGPHTVGVICCIDGHIHSADIFANSRLFEGSRSKLFRSYAIDVQLGSRHQKVNVDMQACKAFLSEIVSAQRKAKEKNALGSTYDVKTDNIEGYESGKADFRGGVGRAGTGYGHGSYTPSGR